MEEHTLTQRLAAEFLGTFVLVFGGCGSAVLTAIFLYVILGATDTRAPKGFAPIAIGLVLTLIHLVSIPVSNTSANPARSTGPALFAGVDALEQLWAFWLAPLVGGAIAGVTYAFLFGRDALAAPLPEATEG